MDIPNNVEAVWEICENSGPSRGKFPFMLVCHRSQMADMGFGCKSLTEAHQKLVALAVEADKGGYKLDLG